MQNGMNMQGLLYIDYAFHLTLIAATLFVLYWYSNRNRLSGSAKAT
jgi:uncharacterized membrane protein